MDEVKPVDLEDAKLRAIRVRAFAGTLLKAEGDEDGEKEARARAEDLERLCDVLGYLERSLIEVQAARELALVAEAVAEREALSAKSDALRIAREVEKERENVATMERELEAQRRRQQRAFADNRLLRVELDTLRRAHRALDAQTEVSDGPEQSAAAPADPR